MSDQSKHTSSHKQRIVRVFVSSTFRDMRDEREELVKFTFPELRKRCRERGVEFVDVDLRWGIPDEQKAEGKVLPICLAEIERCRPYFIGLLGERYGWVPEDIPQELIEQQGWLKEHRGKSVTELEIIHGVLENPEMEKKSFFYFRDPAASAKVEEDLAKKPDYQPEPETSFANLNTLKEKILKHEKNYPVPVRQDFPEYKLLRKRVLEDLWKVIDERFPEKEVPSALDRDAADHEGFAQSRAGVYIGRDEYFKRLDDHVNSDSQPLVVLGESGSGKSALLSNWALKFLEENRSDFLLMHFIGASPYSADWAAMLRRIMGEFKRRFGIEQEIPYKPDELRSAFANWLHMASAKGRIILILDALNQLEDRDGAPDLVWLPPVIPPNIRLILSTLPGRPLDDLTKRAWPTMTVHPLSQEERKLFIEKYLALYTKALSPARAERIAHADQTENPLYLQALLEELRLFGKHEHLNERISYYLEAETVPDLYEKILIRYEKDYEQDRTGLVQEVMSCLWAARRGLLESELLDILGADGLPLPMAEWTPLKLAAEHSLVNRAGFFGFFHDYLNQAVHDRYLSTEEKQHVVHLRLADYFNKLDMSERKTDELPWQLARATSWERLKDLLTQPLNFMAVWQANEFDVKAYWAQLEDNSYHKVDAYQSVLEAPEQTDHEFVWKIAILLVDTGHPDESLLLREFLVERFREAGDKEKLAVCLGGQALIHYARGDLDEAMRLHKEQERLCRELGDNKGLSNSFCNQANILYARGDLDLAMRLYKEDERLCRELGNKDSLSKSLGNQAVILYARGDLDEAMRLHKEQERLCRELGNKNVLLACHCNQAIILYARGDLDEAMRLHKEQERLCRELGNKDGLQFSLGNQANIFYARGDLDEAMRLHKEQERLCRELVNKDGLQFSLGNQAIILYARGDLDEVMRLSKEQEHLCRELGNKHGLSISLSNQAVVLYARGDLDEAMRLYKEQERLCRDLRNLSGLTVSLTNQSELLSEKKGKHQKALPLVEEAYRLASENGLIQLLEQIKPILESIQSKLMNNE